MEIDAFIHLALGIAIVVLAILLSKAESLAITNRTRIGRLENKQTALEFAQIRSENVAEPYYSFVPNMKNKAVGTIEYELEKALEENKSLSFQLAEVSKALQEKKLLIYDTDAKMSELDAYANKMALNFGKKSEELDHVKNLIDEVYVKQITQLEADKNDLIEALKKATDILKARGAQVYWERTIDESDLDLGSIHKYNKAKDLSDFARRYEGQWLDSLKDLQDSRNFELRSDGDIWPKKDKPSIDAEFETYETEPSYTIPTPGELESKMLRALEAEEQVCEMVDKEPKVENNPESSQCETVAKNCNFCCGRKKIRKPYTEKEKIDCPVCQGTGIKN